MAFWLGLAVLTLLRPGTATSTEDTSLLVDFNDLRQKLRTFETVSVAFPLPEPYHQPARPTRWSLTADDAGRFALDSLEGRLLRYTWNGKSTTYSYPEVSGPVVSYRNHLTAPIQAFWDELRTGFDNSTWSLEQPPDVWSPTATWARVDLPETFLWAEDTALYFGIHGKTHELFQVVVVRGDTVAPFKLVELVWNGGASEASFVSTVPERRVSQPQKWADEQTR